MRRAPRPGAVPVTARADAAVAARSLPGRVGAVFSPYRPRPAGVDAGDDRTDVPPTERAGPTLTPIFDLLVTQWRRGG